MVSTSGGLSPKLFDGLPIQEILVPVVLDRGYQQGLAIAAGLAKAWRVPLRAVHVRLADEVSDSTISDITDAFKALHPELIIDGAELAAGDVASGITSLTKDESLIVLASERATQWLQGPSIAETVVQAVPRMVLLAGPSCVEVGTPSAVVVPLDGSERAEAAIEPGVAMANGARVWLVSSVPQATAETVALLRSKGQQVSESAYLRSVAERLVADGVDVGWEIIHDDDPVSAIMSFARVHGASMIVAATHGESGVARRLFGSVCMGMVERGSLPVLIVKSDDESVAELV